MAKNEKNITYANDIAKNLTEEYWPHVALLTDKRHHLIYPMYVYENFKCLSHIVENHLNEEAMILLNKIDTLLLRYTLWANNNKYFKEDELPEDENSFLLEHMHKIHDEVYAELAPHCFKIFNYNLDKDNKDLDKELTEETENILSTAIINIKTALEKGILSPYMVKNIQLQSNFIYQILIKQGAI